MLFSIMTGISIVCNAVQAFSFLHTLSQHWGHILAILILSRYMHEWMSVQLELHSEFKAILEFYYFFFGGLGRSERSFTIVRF